MKSRSTRNLPVFGNMLLLILIGTYYFLIPAGIIVADLMDPGLRTGEIPNFTFRWHRQLSDKFEPWAKERVVSGQAAQLNQSDLSGTEWPIFSAVYYLWATEALQDAWEENPTLSNSMPAEYANGAIQAAVELVTDPNHAAWVIQYWGNSYLKNQNIFYRMLYISGLTSYQRLTGDDQYENSLILQLDTLSAELDHSPYGLLDDYPGQCYPIDILPAIAAIQRADDLLGTDHSASIAHAIRGFQDSRLDPLTQLPAYAADSRSGAGISPTRGVGISYMLIWAPEIWPNVAEDWYTRYEEHFWQENNLIIGMREFSRYGDYPAWSLFHIDAGPVLSGYGTAASAFGIGATRANGHMDQAFPLSAEALLFTWPLPDGTLLGGRLLSNLSDAPFLGETALLFIFTRTPVIKEATPATFHPPGIVVLGLMGYIAIWVAFMFLSLNQLRKQRMNHANINPPNSQFVLWAASLLFAVVLFKLGQLFFAIVFLMAALQLPHNGKTTKTIA